MSIAEAVFGGLMVYMGLRKLNNAIGGLRGDLRGDVDKKTGKYAKHPCPGNGGMKCYLTEGGSIERRAKIIAEKIRKDSLDPRVRKLALQALTERCGDAWCTPPRDGKAEVSKVYADLMDGGSALSKGLRGIEGIFHYVKRNVRYTKDHATTDTFQGALRTLTELHGGDCFPVGTLLLLDDYTFSPVEELRDGMKVWGRDRWSEVQRVWYKGILPVTVLMLNNGSQVRLTEGHHVFVARCQKHNGYVNPCSCPVDEREIMRVSVSELQAGMVLIAPDKIQFGKQGMSPERAWIEGLFIADGWSSHNADFAISGKDGFPKEEQKREVERICKELGIRTRWHERYITVLDADWTLRMQQMGEHAWEKHALSIGLTETAARELLRGIMADSGANTRGNGRTFTTTSRTLMLQTRVLQRMCGVSCGYRYIENHGGLGSHPIYRLQARDQDRSDGKAEKLLRVKGIEREVFPAPCYDITTDDGYVYLPEQDVTVSNCDDHVLALGTLLRSVGYPVKLRIYWLPGDSEPGHIALRVNPDPKSNAWMTLDASVDKVSAGGRMQPVYPGWEASKRQVSKHKDFDV